MVVYALITMGWLEPSDSCWVSFLNPTCKEPSGDDFGKDFNAKPNKMAARSFQTCYGKTSFYD